MKGQEINFIIKKKVFRKKNGYKDFAEERMERISD